MTGKGVKDMLSVKTQAPSFSLPNQSGEIVSLDEFKDKQYLVLYFYPKDDTSGCTLEANQFTSLIDEFTALDTVVIGVSKDTCESHRAFIEKYGLKVELISDLKLMESGKKKRRMVLKRWALCVLLLSLISRGS